MFDAHGKVWKFGDNIDTDLLAPGIYMRQPVQVMAQHCLEAVDAEFASHVHPGDILVAGSGFGIGSSREQAVETLVHLGISVVVARSFARIFYRNAINLGLPVLICPDIEKIDAGNTLRVHIDTGEIHNLDSNKTFNAEPIPKQIFPILESGGLMPYLKKRLKKANNA